jgi:hypothetical protein
MLGDRMGDVIAHSGKAAWVTSIKPERSIPARAAVATPAVQRNGLRYRHSGNPVHPFRPHLRMTR